MMSMKGCCVQLLACVALLLSMQGCEGITLKRGMDTTGTLIARVPNQSRYECYIRCLDMGACKAVVYWPAMRVCYLKGEGEMIEGLKGLELIKPNFDNGNEGNEGDEGSDEDNSDRIKRRLERAANATERRERRRGDTAKASQDNRDVKEEKREMTRLERAAASIKSKPKMDNRFFVHMPRGMGWGTLKLTYQDVGPKPNSYQCNKACFDTYLHKCLYAQWEDPADGGTCFIARTCNPDKQECSSVASINVPGKDLNRVYCRNAYYIQEWMEWEGGATKGPNPCSQITDDGKVRTTFQLAADL